MEWRWRVRAFRVRGGTPGDFGPLSAAGGLLGATWAQRSPSGGPLRPRPSHTLLTLTHLFALPGIVPPPQFGNQEVTRVHRPPWARPQWSKRGPLPRVVGRLSLALRAAALMHDCGTADSKRCSHGTKPPIHRLLEYSLERRSTRLPALPRIGLGRRWRKRWDSLQGHRASMASSAQSDRCLSTPLLAVPGCRLGRSWRCLDCVCGVCGGNVSAPYAPMRDAVTAMLLSTEERDACFCWPAHRPPLPA